MDAIEQSARPMLDQFTPKPLANLMVAAAQLGHRYSDGFMAAAAKQCMLKMPAATPQAVANLLMSFAKLRIGPPLSGDLFRAGLSRALEVSMAAAFMPNGTPVSHSDGLMKGRHA